MPIEAEDEAAFGARIKEIAGEMASEPDAGKRYERYRSLVSLSHPHLIPVFVGSLADPKMGRFHWTARKCLVSLCEREKDWSPIVDYLATRGRAGDAGYFFDHWLRAGVELSCREREKLHRAPCPWVQLYVLKFCERHERINVRLDCLENELNRFSDAVKRLRESLLQDGE